MIQSPTDLVNRAIDAVGLPERIIGDINDGERESEIARRQYGPMLRQLLRAAHWSFARFYGYMQILGDVTGQTKTPQGMPISNQVEPPWLYAYAWPIDCLLPIWVPWNGLTQSTVVPPGNISQSVFSSSPPGTPQLSGLNQLPTLFERQRPARFLSSTSAAFPPIVGQASWQEIDGAISGEGVGVSRRRVILTNVPPLYDTNNNVIGAPLVYTGLVLECQLWDSLFEQGFVSAMGERLCIALMVDPEASIDDQAKQRQAAIQVRNAQIAIAKEAIREARVISANEQGFPQNATHVADWIRAHRIYGGGGVGRGEGGWGGWDNAGSLWGGWDGYCFGSGETF